jgi:hypothetical protein
VGIQASCQKPQCKKKILIVSSFYLLPWLGVVSQMQITGPRMTFLGTLHLEGDLVAGILY